MIYPFIDPFNIYLRPRGVAHALLSGRLNCSATGGRWEASWNQGIPSKHTKNDGKSPFFIGKSPFFIGKSPFFIGKSVISMDNHIFSQVKMVNQLFHHGDVLCRKLWNDQRVTGDLLISNTPILWSQLSVNPPTATMVCGGVFDIRGWDYIRYSSNIGLYLYPPAIKHGNPDIPERNWHLSVKIIKLNGGFSSKPCYEVAEGCGGQYSLQERLTSIIQTRMLVAICLCCCTYLDVWPIGGREFTYSSRLGTAANPLYHPVGYVQRNV